jgi:hypothetical protein
MAFGGLVWLSIVEAEKVKLAIEYQEQFFVPLFLTKTKIFNPMKL